MKQVTKMNREQTEKYLIKDLIAKADRVAFEAVELKDFLIKFTAWKYQSSEKIQSSEETQEES